MGGEHRVLPVPVTRRLATLQMRERHFPLHLWDHRVPSSPEPSERLPNEVGTELCRGGTAGGWEEGTTGQVDAAAAHSEVVEEALLVAATVHAGTEFGLESQLAEVATRAVGSILLSVRQLW